MGNEGVSFVLWGLRCGRGLSLSLSNYVFFSFILAYKCWIGSTIAINPGKLKVSYLILQDYVTNVD